MPVDMIMWMGLGKPVRPQPYRENDRQPRSAESGRHSLLQGRAHLLIQYQVVIPESINTSNSIHTEQVVLMYLGIYACTHTCTCIIAINEIEAMCLTKEQGGFVRGFGGKKGKGEVLELYFKK